MRKLLLLATAAVALAAAVPARAALTFDGQTGIGRLPTADVLPRMSLGAGADYVFSADTFMPLRVGFGVLDRLEVGAHFWFVDTEAIDNYWGVNAKYRLPFTLAEGLGFAVGAAFQTRTMKIGDDITTLEAYGVASYDVQVESVTLQPTVGLKWVLRDFGDTDENGFKFQAGIVAMVLPNLGFGAELITENEDVDPRKAAADVWLGVRYVPLRNLTVQAGIMNNADVGGEDDLTGYVVHLGVQYDFSFAR